MLHLLTISTTPSRPTTKRKTRETQISSSARRKIAAEAAEYAGTGEAATVSREKDATTPTSQKKRGKRQGGGDRQRAKRSFEEDIRAAMNEDWTAAPSGGSGT